MWGDNYKAEARFALNYKGLDYKTDWLEYPNIQPRLEKHLPGRELYTIPTVVMPNGDYIMDSFEIAQALEKAFPTPSLHLESPYLEKLSAVMPDTMGALVGIFVPLIPERLLNEASKPYWYEKREAKVGMPLDRLAREKGGDEAWKAAEPHLRKVTALLGENADGPFFMGKEVSYADFVWAGCLIFYRRIGDDVFQKLLDATGDRDLHLKLLEGVEPWSERDDH
ncbi:hypothetical protein DL766_006324 [Monosporascus sp. MC13-8B]|uniref:GST N-terminal domain-containing protein n=1 Tax=Monosporascus cannonballus TaxID=155416 RepID=A0ABY0H1L3_9PEZI|nr:hypothetical protein DL762_006598 [Monosporascus cannonballus]RYO90165.1 hypothetical protein DL763_005406 [Monosporascus cannonballus]RYP27540.1 hypothetical protein DL766_006324 [Monosporascus sp. MC13-8B]